MIWRVQVSGETSCVPKFLHPPLFYSTLHSRSKRSTDVCYFSAQYRQRAAKAPIKPPVSSRKPSSIPFSSRRTLHSQMARNNSSVSATDLSKADSASTTYRVTRNMVYPIVTSSSDNYYPHRASQRPRAQASTGERYSYHSSSRSPASSRVSSSTASSSPSSSSSSPLTSYTSATAPLSQSTADSQFSPPVSYKTPQDSSNPAIFPLFRHTTYTSSRQNVRDLLVNTSSQATQPESASTTSYGLPNGTPPGYAAFSYQNALNPSDSSLRTNQEQLLANHDLPRTLPPLPNLQTSNNFSALQHTYFSMLAQGPAFGALMKQPTSDASAPAGAATYATLDGLLESGVFRSHADRRCDDEIEQWLNDVAYASPSPTSSVAAAQSHSAADERSATSEPLSFDHLFNNNSQQSTSTAPATPYVHDASAFTTMQGSLPSTMFPQTTADENAMLNAFAAHFDFDPADQSMLAAAQSTPPSASEPPALSFSPTSPYDAALSGTPGTGLSLMDVDFDGDYDGMPLFGFEDGFTRPLFFNDEAGGVAPSALGLKGVAAPPSAAAPVEASAPVAPTSALSELDGLIAMNGTPSLVTLPLSTTFNTDASLPPTSSPVESPSNLRSATRPTGHRKNLSPSALLPMDAPTQTRSYRGPSATSRKDIPAFALGSSSSRAASSSTKSAINNKKRKAEEDPEDLEDDADEEEMRSGKIKPRMGESEIEAKRRQNTLAARRSRHRKLAYVRELEEKVIDLMRQNEMMAERLRGAGLEP